MNVPLADQPVSPVTGAADTGWGHRIIPLAAAAGLFLGSALFLAGGRAHPGIQVLAGAAPEAFFRTFAETVHHTEGWHGMHMMILVGPLLWAVAAPALLEALRPQARTTGSTARALLVVAGCLWATAFVLDGFGAPVYAQALTATPADASNVGLLTAFAANAVMMSRLGLVGWVVGGLGIAVLGVSLLPTGVRTRWRAVVGVSGILLGLWPLMAALEGEYAGGPFTSRFWIYNALLVGLWYVALATCAFGRPASRDVGRTVRPAHRI